MGQCNVTKGNLIFNPFYAFFATKFSTCDSQLCDRFFHTTQNCDEYPFSRMETGYCVGLEKRKKYREIK